MKVTVKEVSHNKKFLEPAGSQLCNHCGGIIREYRGSDSCMMCGREEGHACDACLGKEHTYRKSA